MSDSVRLKIGVIECSEESWFQVTRDENQAVLLEFIDQERRYRWFAKLNKRGRIVNQGRQRFDRDGMLRDAHQTWWIQPDGAIHAPWQTFLDCVDMNGGKENPKPAIMITLYSDDMVQMPICLRLVDARLLVCGLLKALANHKDDLALHLAEVYLANGWPSQDDQSGLPT